MGLGKEEKDDEKDFDIKKLIAKMLGKDEKDDEKDFDMKKILAMVLGKGERDEEKDFDMKKMFDMGKKFLAKCLGKDDEEEKDFDMKKILAMVWGKGDEREYGQDTMDFSMLKALFGGEEKEDREGGDYMKMIMKMLKGQKESRW